MGSRYQAVKKGGPFEVVQASKPDVGKNEVLIKIKAVALNPIDWKQLELGLYVPSWPATLGGDGAGIVEAVGEDVKSFKQGDEVFGRFTAGNNKTAAFQSFAALEVAHVGKKPKSWSFEDAASLPIAFLTAAAAVYKELGISLPFLPGGRESGYKPESILVLGGSSSVGATTVQLLRLVLPDAIILTTSSSKHHSLLTSLGATTAFDYKSPNVVEEIKKASPNGQGVEAIIDPVNAVALEPSLLQLLIGPKHFAEVATGRNIDVSTIPTDVKHHLVLSQTVIGSTPGGSNLLAALGQIGEEGKFKVPLPVTVVGQGFDAIGEGLQILKKGVSGTKLAVSL